MSGAIPPAAGVAAGWALALALAAAGYRSRRRVPLSIMLPRLPGVVVFGGLLALYGRDDPALVAWALAFGLPFAAITGWRRQ